MLVETNLMLKKKKKKARWEVSRSNPQYYQENKDITHCLDILSYHIIPVKMYNY